MKDVTVLDLPSNRLWTVEEAAYFLGVPKKTLYQWSWLSEGPPVRKIGRYLRYDPERLKAWAAADEAA